MRVLSRSHLVALVVCPLLLTQMERARSSDDHAAGQPGRSVSSVAANAPGRAAVLPAPQRYEQLAGSLRFLPSRTGIVLSVNDLAGVMPAISEICSTSVLLYGEAPALNVKKPITIWAGVTGHDLSFDRLCKKHGITPGDTLGREGYTLVVADKEILIAARETPGLFYGLMTVNQILRGAAGADGVIRRLRIIDWPDQRVRGVMDDISRGPVPTPEYFRQQIRRLAEMKVNTISYYTEHVVATRSHPEFAPPGAALSIDEWKALAGFARKYHIDLVGGFQSFGHFDKILAHPRYAHLAEGKSLLSPAFEESYALLRDIYSEMVPAFSAPFFMTHCDETFDLGKGPSRKLVDSLGIGRVYAGHILRLHEMLRALGVRMMIWGDILLEHQEVLDLIPKDVVIGTWTYDSLADYHRYIKPFQSKGFDVLVTPGVLNSFSVLPNFRVSRENIARFIRDGIANKVLGTMTTVWDDGGNALFSRDWYGVAFAADRMWHCNISDTTYDARFDVALYGDHAKGISRGIQHLLRLTELTPTDGFNERSIWSPVLPDSGRMLRLNVLEWDQVLDIARSADSLFQTGQPLIYQGDIEALRFSADLFQAAARLRLGVLRAAGLYGRAVTTAAGGGASPRTHLLETLEILASLRAEFMGLKSRYAALWLAENRLHALGDMEVNYDEVIARLADTGRRVRAALGCLERNEPLPPPPAARLAILESVGWYFRDWLVAGPMNGNQLDIDRLTTMGGEKNAAPLVTQEFQSDNVTQRWKRLSLQIPEVDFGAQNPGARNATVYAYATLESPSARTIRALIGVGGTCRLFVNGELAYERRQEDSLVVDGHETQLPLQAGKNRLLFKVCGGEGGSWGFSFQLPGTDVRGRKNRYRIR
ncbi:MAG: hypothetical protein H6Q30_2156 [Bacteroidetes bacterium]|nr:hypothetical protein [Bacteroidota bacterium]